MVKIRAKRSQLGPGAQEWARAVGRPRRGAIVQNEANSSMTDWKHGCGRSQSCKTKPIPPAGTRPEARGTRGKCAKRTQFGWSGGAPESEMRQTNPIPWHGPRRVQAGGVTSGAVAQVYCAKRTQFAADGRGRPSPRPEALTMPPMRNKCVKQTQFPPGRDTPAIPRRWRSCETNPICLATPGGTRPRGAGRGANRAKRTQFGEEFQVWSFKC